MKISEAAHRSLQELGQPSHVTAIRRHIEENRYFSFGAQVPERALGVALDRRAQNVEISRKVLPVLFYRHAPATYGLLSWLDEGQLARLDTTATDLAAREEEAELDTSLLLERELHRWLYKNLEKNGLAAMNLGKLCLFDPEGQADSDGKYYTPIGEIDMLLTRENGDLVVIELKRSSDDATVGQLCRYFGWVREELAKGAEVLGVILAQGANEKLRYALEDTNPNIYYQELEIEIHLKPRSR